jgi:hypothetical protein
MDVIEGNHERGVLCRCAKKGCDTVEEAEAIGVRVSRWARIAQLIVIKEFWKKLGERLKMTARRAADLNEFTIVENHA